jgi:hypothetical protein
VTAALRYTIGDPGRAAERIGDGQPTPFPEWPDADVRALSALGLTVRAASVRGLAHRAYGAPRQDAHNVRELDCGALVAVVCDGVGSLDFSHEAAALAAAALPDLLAARDGRTDWSGLFIELSTRVREQAERDGEPPRPMATTVAAAVITRAPTGAYRAELGWLGDSSAWLLHAGTWLCLTDPPVGDELTTGATAALPAEMPDARSTAAHLAPGDALFLMSDGVGTPLGSGQGEVGATLAQWWASPPQADDFAAQVAFARRSFDDDRTAIGLWSLSDPGPAA